MKFLFLFCGLIFNAIQLFGQTIIDTLQYSPDAPMYVREYDSDRVLRLECTYFPLANNKLGSEKVYLKDGSVLSETIWYGHGMERNVFIRNETSGKLEGTEFDSTGCLTQTYEKSDSLSDACFMSFYKNGSVQAEGFKRIVSVCWANYVDDKTIGLPLNNPPCQCYPSEANVGYWKYYYANGKDSADGNYYPIGYYACDSMPKESDYDGNAVVILVLGYLFTENKDGAWNYFSPEGKLITTEEWNKGHLISRKEY